MNRNADFFKVLSWLLGSGIPLVEALQIMEQGSSRKTASVLGRLLRHGHSLSEAMILSKRFRALDCHGVMAGENSGALANKLLKISEMIERENKAKKTLLEALSYPAVVLLSSISALVVMSLLVSPMLSSILQKGGQELPQLTRILLGFSDALPLIGVFIIGLFALLLLLAFLLKRNPANHMRMWRILLGTPLVGSWIRYAALQGMSLNLMMLLDAGISLYDALLMLASKGLPYPYRSSMKKTADALLAGKSLFSCLQDTLLYDPVFRHLIMAAEKSGELSSALSSLAGYYEEGLRRLSTNLRNKLEPAMILMSGIVVGLVVLGFYLPMFEISSGMGR